MCVCVCDVYVCVCVRQCVCVCVCVCVCLYGTESFCPVLLRRLSSSLEQTDFVLVASSQSLRRVPQGFTLQPLSD